MARPDQPQMLAEVKVIRSQNDVHWNARKRSVVLGHATKWEEPQPHGGPAPSATSTAQARQQQSTLKEPSLVFVRSQIQNQAVDVIRDARNGDDAPVPDMTPGTRIQAKLETQISSTVSAPVVAVVEYTYAIGTQ